MRTVPRACVLDFGMSKNIERALLRAVLGPSTVGASGNGVSIEDVLAGRVRYVINPQTFALELRQWKEQAPAKAQHPMCGARTRTGAPCRARVCLRSNGTLAARCRNHGRLSTGPKTQAGRAAIGAANKARSKPEKT